MLLHQALEGLAVLWVQQVDSQQIAQGRKI